MIGVVWRKAASEWVGKVGQTCGVVIGEDWICGTGLIDEVGTGVVARDGSTRWGLGQISLHQLGVGSGNGSTRAVAMVDGIAACSWVGIGFSAWYGLTRYGLG